MIRRILRRYVRYTTLWDDPKFRMVEITAGSRVGFSFAVWTGNTNESD